MCVMISKRMHLFDFSPLCNFKCGLKLGELGFMVEKQSSSPPTDRAIGPCLTELDKWPSASENDQVRKKEPKQDNEKNCRKDFFRDF